MGLGLLHTTRNVGRSVKPFVKVGEGYANPQPVFTKHSNMYCEWPLNYRNTQREQGPLVVYTKFR